MGGGGTINGRFGLRGGRVSKKQVREKRGPHNARLYRGRKERIAGDKNLVKYGRFRSFGEGE